MSRDDDLPDMLPEVEWTRGEPRIVREQVIRPSPVPRSLAIILVVLAALGIAQVISSEIRDRDRDRRVDSLVETNSRLIEDNRRLIRDLESVTDQLQAEVSEQDRNQARLQALVQALLLADSNEEQRQILEDFLVEQRAGDEGSAGDLPSTPSDNPASPEANGDPRTPDPPSGPAPAQPEPQPPPAEPEPEPQPEPPGPLDPVTEPVCSLTGVCI